jgi:8-oxo-dGTP diphosphatase
VRFAFCPNCAAPTAAREAGGRDRDYCPRCDRIYYENPIVGAAGVLVEDGRVLLARRASSVFPGRWYVPSGFVEADETVEEATVREMLEETGLNVEITGLIDANSGFEVAGRPVVGVYFSVRRTRGVLAPGDDVDRLEFFPLDAVPDLVFAGDRRVIGLLREGRWRPAGPREHHGA